MINWKLQTIPIKDLKNHPKNPRQISKEQLQHLENLIKKFGLIDKPIVNLDFTIIGGHQRIKILKRMKEKQVECWIPDQQLSEKDVEELLIKHNLNQGSWDFDILADRFDPLELLSYGFTEQQLIGSFEEVEENESEEKKKKLKECPSCGCQF